MSVVVCVVNCVHFPLVLLVHVEVAVPPTGLVFHFVLQALLEGMHLPGIQLACGKREGERGVKRVQKRDKLEARGWIFCGKGQKTKWHKRKPPGGRQINGSPKATTAHPSLSAVLASQAAAGQL